VYRSTIDICLVYRGEYFGGCMTVRKIRFVRSFGFLGLHVILEFL
jgi:hypothetical protein